jgi:hypothetical protein
MVNWWATLPSSIRARSAVGITWVTWPGGKTRGAMSCSRPVLGGRIATEVSCGADSASRCPTWLTRLGRLLSAGSVTPPSCGAAALAASRTCSTAPSTLARTRPSVIREATSEPNATTRTPETSSVMVTIRSWSERRQARRIDAQAIAAW